MFQGPRPLLAELRNSPETPCAMSAARRRPGVFHWRQRAARNRNRTQRVESDQHLGRFAEAEIAAPAPHILGQLFHCRLDADALDPSRGLSDSLLSPPQPLWLVRSLD